MAPMTNIQLERDPLPEFVSRQVTEARRFFLNLDPNRTAPLEIVCGGVERMRPEYVVDRVNFPYYALEYVAAGQGSLTICNQTFPLIAGSVFAYGPGTPHTIQNDKQDGMRKFYLDFVGTKATRFLREAGLITGRSVYGAVNVGRHHELTGIFELLLTNAVESGPLTGTVCESIVQLLFLKIRQLRIPQGNQMPRAYSTYEQIRQHIAEHFLDLHSAQQIAEQCDVTPVYLSRLFKRFSSCGAYQYLLQLKMNYAAGLLMNEGLLVKEVASRLSYPDPFQFSRSFRRVYGIPPAELISHGRS
ncbi:MAG: helix-turn-helix transcriptional regulator [Planctomycetaceae bacterium]|nr:helix-turn-helix transcriptional regulator [Planctomycetaceae bacterium]